MLAIGQNQGLEGEIPLRYAHDDARAYVRLLQGQGGVAPRHTIVLTEATPSSLKKSLGDIARLAAKADGDVVFFFYYSGHGDSQSLHLGKSRFKLSDLNQSFSEIPAKLRVSVIDACRSKDDTQAKGFRTNAPSRLESRHHKGSKVSLPHIRLPMEKRRRNPANGRGSSLISSWQPLKGQLIGMVTIGFR